MTLGADVRALADELDALRWSITPFWATYAGVPGHDADVHDVSAAAETRHRAAATGVLDRARALAGRVAGEPLDDAGAVTLAVTEFTAASLVAGLDAGLPEFTVSPMGEGPGLLLVVASVTVPADEAGAADHLTRCRRLGGYLDGCAQRLREGAAAGRTPVRALVERTLAQIDGYLSSEVAVDPLVTVPAPPGWAGEPAWRAELLEAVRDVVRPAVERYRETVTALLPASRGDDAPGLAHLPGGADTYERLVLVHTSLPLTAADVHATGVAAVAGLRAEMARVGERLGLDSFDAVREAVRASSSGVEPQAALDAARAAVARAEAALPGWFAEPLPPPCRVEAMSTHLGAAGTPPHYSPPTADGRRPGTFWFNVDELGPGAGWDLAVTAFHEAVPGHHLQTERMLTRVTLPPLQRFGEVTAFDEGWGLYAELLAGEMGLYGDDDRALLGALGARIFRAARLVVDTGLHAFGWSRTQAVEYLADNAPLTGTFVESEVDRYIAMPGQALAYYTGFAELLRLREGARERLGERFSVAGFHAAVLDNGAAPLPAVARAVDVWAASLA